MNNKLVLFQEKQIRRIWHNEEWHFSIIDIIEILTESTKPSNYWDTLKRHESQLSSICGKFKFLAPDGKMRSTECANTEGYSASLCPYHCLRLSHLNYGWRKSVKSAWLKLKILKWHWKGLLIIYNSPFFNAFTAKSTARAVNAI